MKIEVSTLLVGVLVLVGFGAIVIFVKNSDSKQSAVLDSTPKTKNVFSVLGFAPAYAIDIKPVTSFVADDGKTYPIFSPEQYQTFSMVSEQYWSKYNPATLNTQTKTMQVDPMTGQLK